MYEQPDASKDTDLELLWPFARALIESTAGVLPTLPNLGLACKPVTAHSE